MLIRKYVFFSLTISTLQDDDLSSLPRASIVLIVRTKNFLSTNAALPISPALRSQRQQQRIAQRRFRPRISAASILQTTKSADALRETLAASPRFNNASIFFARQHTDETKATRPARSVRKRTMTSRLGSTRAQQTTRRFGAYPAK